MALIIVTPTATTSGTAATTRAPTTAARASAATAARRSTTIGLGTGLIDIQSASAQFFAVKRGNGFLRFGGVGHFDKGKAARTASIAIGHDADLLDGPMRLRTMPATLLQSCCGGCCQQTASS